MQTTISLMGCTVSIITGDITESDADAIVNAANSSLLGGGGVDGAIHRAGGPAILEECRKIRESLYPEGLPAGFAVTTTGGKMKTRYVVHTVGPVWHNGTRDEDNTLRNCYLSCLAEGERLKCKKIAFPAISTGVYGFPKERAARIVSKTIAGFHFTSLEKIDLVFFSESDLKTFLENADWES